MPSDTETQFSDKLHAIVAKEAAEARKTKDVTRMVSMIELLARALGFSIAIASGGDPKKIDELISGAEAYAHREAVEKATLARIFQVLK
jgi:hypothetical protein